MNPGRYTRATALALCALIPGAIGCHRGEHGHSHDDHGHSHGHGVEESEPEPLAITKWTDLHELFVEFPPPVPGKPVPYHAHVTRLDGFQAVTEGTFHVRFKTSAGVAAETSIQGVKRPGIFTPEGPAPAAGSYTLEMAYEYAGKTDVFDCGPITVAAAPPSPEPDAGGGAITFLKESQWKIPFGTAWADARPMSKEIEIAATVEPAASDQLTIGAPTGGRFFHDPKRALAEGLRVAKGDVLGAIAPTVAGDDYTRLQFATEESRLEKEQIEREIARIEPLAKDGLVPERRLIELRNQLDAAQARLRSAQGRIGRVLSPGGAGGITIKSTLDGIVSQVLVPNGEPVEAGAPLVRIGGTDHLWIRARFVARPASTFEQARPTAVRLPSGERLDIEERGARFLSLLPVIDAGSRIATWIADVPPLRSAGAPAGGGTPAQAAAPPQDDLRPGASVVLAARLGAPRTALAVPRAAVVEIDTRPYVFVQADGEHFEKRRVTLGDADGAFVEVRSGVAKGERIVTRGGFDVHLASLMGTVESHRH
ncbi:efflux RND transporter periplasmic adaptor subunit [Sorangium sp. So ce363]|uniref:efflux RND transporter periplasmic adaptor subunit n=1 Tax=Sorangium sp. So ce363 TaxID=3133304 RepID=UPI003F645D5A